MIASADKTIIEEVRSMKEANAAEYGFDISLIIQAARERQEASGRRIIRQAEQGETTSTSEQVVPGN
jgi:hypothetical protein